MGQINDLVKEAYETAVSKGWHEKERSVAEALALVHAEVSEALEAARKGDKENFAEELGDTIIRIFDLSVEFDVMDLEKAIIDKMAYNKTRPYKHGGKRF